MIRAVMGNLVFFHYDQGFRAQKVALQLFKDFQGVIQTDGRLKIDNNLGENAIRPIALGRKNWLFCGNHDAAENAAIMYSMPGCCKASEVNFRDRLVYFLNNIHTYDNDYSKNLAELLPHNFKLQNPNCNSSVS